MGSHRVEHNYECTHARTFEVQITFSQPAALAEKLGKQNLRSVYWLPMAAFGKIL